MLEVDKDCVVDVLGPEPTVYRDAAGQEQAGGDDQRLFTLYACLYCYHYIMSALSRGYVSDIVIVQGYLTVSHGEDFSSHDHGYNGSFYYQW